MTDYSPEPPRKHLLVHHTFDDVELDRVVDRSPQSTDGVVVGDVTFGYDGVVGSAARMASDDSEVKITPLSESFPLDELHAVSWGRSEREVEVTAQNAYASVVVDGTEYHLSHSTDEPTDEWQYASLRYDGEQLQLRYGQRDEGEPTLADTVDVQGEITNFELTFYTSGYGFVDDVRVYRRALTPQQDSNLFSIGARHNSVPELRDVWDSDALPFRGGNEQFAATYGEETDRIFRELDAIREARHIEDAAGEQLDAIGALASIGRRENERDPHYRARIIAELAAARSAGTFEDILTTTATILDTDETRVSLEYAWESDSTKVATANIYARTADIESVELSTSELGAILEDSVLAGHDVEVLERGSNPFTLVDDTMANDSSRGLTADDISTGGGLVSDA